MRESQLLIFCWAGSVNLDDFVGVIGFRIFLIGGKDNNNFSMAFFPVQCPGKTFLTVATAIYLLEREY
jgi:hypothetical protein